MGLAAEHFEQAGDEAKAVEFHARAAEEASERLVHDRVLSHVSRALALLGEPQPTQAELRWRLLSAREKTYALQARRAEQADDLDALAQLAEMLDDDRRRAEVARRLSVRAVRMADWATMESAARHGLACATRAGDDSLRLNALRLLAQARAWQGDYEAARTLAVQGLAEARFLKLRGIEARLLSVLSIATDLQGDILGNLDLTRQSLQISRETGDRVNEAISLSNLGAGWMNLGDLAQARRELEAALRLLRANGDRTMEGLALVHLSALALWQGDETWALALARSALDVAVAAQARDMEGIAGLRLGEAELALGRLGAARQAYAQARARALEIDDPAQHDASAGLACVALAAGDTAAALAALQPLLDHVAAGGTLDGAECPRRIELTCHQTLARAGDPRDFDWLARAYAALIAQADTISGNTADAALRQGFLDNIPHHSEIVAAWAKRRVACEPSANPAS